MHPVPHLCAFDRSCMVMPNLPYMRPLLLLLLSCSFAASAQPLSAIEQQLVHAVDAGMPATIELLRTSVNINSGTMNTAGVRQVGDLYGKALEVMGFTVEWVSLPDSLKRAGHLVATRTGSRGKKLFLIGHLDTVFEPDMPENPYRQLTATTATGQGVVDMKGGDVLVIAALNALNSLGLLNDVSITVYFTGDEEAAGEPREVSRGDFIRRAKNHDIAIAFEGAGNLNTVTAARRGSSEWILEVSGKQAHSSTVFGAPGYGSIYEAARIINSFREQLGREQYLTFNPGVILGGTELQFNEASLHGSAAGKNNIIAPSTVVTGDLRFLTEQQKQAARATMKKIVAQHLPGTSASIRFQDGIPSMPPTPGNLQLVQLVSKASMALGYGPVLAGDPGARGAGDISYVAGYLDCIDGMGASGKGAHAPGEVIDLEEYPKLIKRAALVIYRLTR